jgi:oligopeptide transport system substrate-binding protein
VKNLVKLGILASVILAVWLYTKRADKPQNKNEKVLYTVNEAPIKGFDPVLSNDLYTTREVAKLYEGLLEYHYLKRPYELVPNLAVAMPTVSEDGCVYTFTIKNGVKFHDNACFPASKGRELVAEDFVYTLKRVADPKVRSPWFSMLAGRIKGLDAWRSKHIEATQTDYNEVIAGIQAVDKYTLQFTLTQPWSQFLYILAMNFCCVVPQEAVQHYGPSFLNHPVGTGPFILEEFKPQLSKLVYHKNPTFREKFYPSEASEDYQHLLADAGQKLPLVDKVITHILPEEQPRWLKFQQGQVDVLDISRDNIALEVVQGNKLDAASQAKGIQLILEPEQSTSFFVFNNDHALFKNNAKLRRAMSLAFDSQRYNELFYNGSAVLAQAIIPSGLAGYQEAYVNSYGKYNLQKAKQLLVEAGYPGGQGLPEITLDANASTNQRQRAEFFRKCMERIGVKIRVVPNIFPELLKKMSQKKTMMHAIAWSADYPDADTFLCLLYKSDQTVGIGAYFNDPAYNDLYERAVAMKPSSERTALYEQLNQRAAACVPAICAVHQVHPLLYQGWVKNVLWADCLYGTEQYINIDLAQKLALKAKF